MGRLNERPDEELDPRCREVLRELISQYIDSGEPISSRTLAKSGRFGLSPASLRNVMADLEDLGYLFQPHTSSGRVPTDRGYRFFIDHLMRSRRITLHEREAIDDHVAQVSNLEDVVQVASRVISKLSDQVGIVFMPTIGNLTVRSINLISVSEHRVMIVLVATNGVVVNRIIETPAATLAAEELERIGRYITTEFGGKSLSFIRDQLVQLMAGERSEQDAVHRRSLEMGMTAVDEVLPFGHDLHVEGAASILNKPEYAADASAMRKTILAFEEKERLVEILNRCLTETGVQILVGSESDFTQSYNFSLVATRYGAPSSPTGLVGVIGPTRMEYARIATLVDYLGRALSRKIEESQEQNS